MSRNIFTIPPGAPFLKTFVDAFLAGDIIPGLSRTSPPLDFARTTIYVPTQRAGRALAAQFARGFDAGATLLPRILPLGGLEEQETAALMGEAADFVDDDLPAPIEELERRLLLAQLVMAWSRAISHAIISIDASGAHELDTSAPFLVANSPVAAFALAADLGALIDEFAIEDIAAEKINTVVDAEFDKYWSITTNFLRIALEKWPAILEEKNRIDAALRQKRLVEAQIAALAGRGAGGPVIALGSTGARITTAQLLSTIASLENGAVILPGLDCVMTDAAWLRVGDNDGEPAFSHPQTMLKRLLETMKLSRADVREIGVVAPSLSARRALVSQAMAPADATSAWRDYRAAQENDFAAALDGVTALYAPDERMEALALALFLREALETPGRTAALVTPDRDIARRVAAELLRFEIAVDDSGGFSLASTPEGALARLIAAIGAEGLSAVNVSALFAHPLTRFGLTAETIARLRTLIDVGVLRMIGAGAQGWAASVASARVIARGRHAHPAAQRIAAQDWDAIAEAMRRLDAAFAPYAALKGDSALAAWAGAQRAAFEAVTMDGEESADAPALFDLFTRFIEADAPDGFDAGSYAALFDRVTFETTLRGPRRAHPRLKILGPLEARLIDADLILLAGLDEGVWPPQTETGAFLNRSMRRQLGLTPPERRIGQSAHDFVMALGADNVVLSRAEKRNGSPTVASRFLARLEALAGEAFKDCKTRGKRMLDIAEALDRPRESVTLARPLPCPALDLRPTQLSVTRIEVLRRDPYAIYAQYVLELAVLAPLGAEIGAREMGTAIHEALADFVALHPRGPLPADAREQLYALAQDKLRAFFVDPMFVRFTWPRVQAGLDHALAFELESRAEGRQIFVETNGAWIFPLDDGSNFKLTAVADRIEIDAPGLAYVYDYKTGDPPSKAQVQAGWSPQLTLEAAMLEAGAFKDIGAHTAAGAAYIGLKNGGKTTDLTWKDKSFADVVADHRAEAVRLLSQYRDAATPYPSRPFVAFISGVGDYDHLARVKEWTRGGGDGA